MRALMLHVCSSCACVLHVYSCVVLHMCMCVLHVCSCVVLHMCSCAACVLLCSVYVLVLKRVPSSGHLPAYYSPRNCLHLEKCLTHVWVSEFRILESVFPYFSKTIRNTFLKSLLLVSFYQGTMGVKPTCTFFENFVFGHLFPPPLVFQKT